MKDYEIVIIGAGPAGLQAGIHAGRRRHKVLIIGKPENSALYNAHIENYFGFPDKVDGKVLIEAGLTQIARFGVDLLREDVVKIETLDGGDFLVETEKGEKIKATVLILAMGVKKKKKLLKNEDQYVGKGISYCVDCDAWFYRGKEVAVIGDGSAAVHGAVSLTKFAKRVYLILLKDEPELERELQGVQVEILKTKPLEIIGEEEVKGLRLESGEELLLDGIFIELGAKGPLELLGPIGIELDPETLNYVKVDIKMRTNVPGVFACGDLTGPPLQLAKAVGEGCIAGLSASDYLKSRKG